MGHFVDITKPDNSTIHSHDSRDAPRPILLSETNKEPARPEGTLDHVPRLTLSYRRPQPGTSTLPVHLAFTLDHLGPSSPAPDS